jgi:precorrin-3B C17-methyltransferase
MGMTKFAVTPGFEVGGSFFKPEQLILLGSIVGEDAKIELTTFKQLYVDMHEERIDEVKQKLSAIGFEIYPAGIVSKSLITCNFCKGAKDAGLEVAEKLNQAIAGLVTPSALKIGYAGCALGTSEPLLKDIGVVKMRDTFDIYIGGDPRSIKPVFATLLVSDVRSDKLISVVQRLVYYYQKNGKKKEKFLKFIQRITIDTLREVLEVA